MSHSFLRLIQSTVSLLSSTAIWCSGEGSTLAAAGSTKWPSSPDAGSGVSDSKIRIHNLRPKATSGSSIGVRAAAVWTSWFGATVVAAVDDSASGRWSTAPAQADWFSIRWGSSPGSPWRWRRSLKYTRTSFCPAGGGKSKGFGSSIERFWPLLLWFPDLTLPLTMVGCSIASDNCRFSEAQLAAATKSIVEFNGWETKYMHI